MLSDPLIAQVALTIPVCLGLTIYTLLRWERATLHAMLVLLLMSVTVWLLGTALRVGASSDALRQTGLDIEIVSVLLMAPLFLITMGYFARSPSFEQSNAVSIALLSVSGFLLLGYLTDSQHHLFVADREQALAGAAPSSWAGPMFWGSQMWNATADLVALSYAGSVLLRAPNRRDRQRAMMILIAVLIPTAAHAVYALDLAPIGYSLSPLSVALAAGCFVQGVHRHGLIGGQTIVRHDLMDYLDEGLVLASHRGTVLDVNPAAEHALGASRDDLCGMLLSDTLSLLDASCHDAARSLGEQIMALSPDADRVLADSTTADGRIIELKGGAIPALGSQPGGRFVALTDVTVARRSEQQLRERQKLESVGILAAGVAHEINNPLSYVRANLCAVDEITTSLAKNADAPETAELPDLLSESIEGLDRIAKIVQSMLRFSRVPDERPGPVAVEEVIEEATRLMSLHEGSPLRCSGPDSKLPPVLGSHDRLVQVLLNLYLNAKQSGGPKVDVETRVSLSKSHVVIDVHDNGPGIEPEIRSRIFDPFFTTREAGEGTGLGLSIAADIVREHGGELTLEGDSGSGATFTIRLPSDSAS